MKHGTKGRTVIVDAWGSWSELRLDRFLRSLLRGNPRNVDRLVAWTRRYFTATGNIPSIPRHVDQVERGLSWPLQRNRTGNITSADS